MSSARAVTQRLAPALRNGKALAPVSAVGLRAVSTASMNDAEAMALLNKQRMVRPSSPWHIYKPQLTSVTSIANRATGTGLSLAFYAFALSYAAAPALGIPFSGQSVVNLVANLPGWFVVLAKTALSGSFWFHTWNGIRHLSWDSGRLLNLQTAYYAGYTVIGLTAVSTAYTVFLL